jgi:hypothetical protein
MRMTKSFLLVLLWVSALSGCGVQWFPSPSSSVSISTQTLPGGTVGTAYSQQLSGFGGTTPYSWALASGSTLPAGLTLSPAGVISGTPTTAGTSTFTVQITDSSTPPLTATQSLSITVTSTATIQTPPPGSTVTLVANTDYKVPNGTTVSSGSLTINGVSVTAVMGNNLTGTATAGTIIVIPPTNGLVADNTITVP